MLKNFALRLGNTETCVMNWGARSNPCKMKRTSRIVPGKQKRINAVKNKKHIWGEEKSLPHFLFQRMKFLVRAFGVFVRSMHIASSGVERFMAK